MRRITVAAVALAGLAVVELAVLVAAARTVGFGATLLLVLATVLLGGWLLRREGTRAWRQLVRLASGPRSATRPGPGQPAPGEAASRGLVGLLAGTLLLLPGFVTDLAGLLLLVPPVRTVAAGLVRTAAERRLSPAAAGEVFGPHRVPSTARPGGGPAGEVVEGEIVD